MKATRMLRAALRAKQPAGGSWEEEAVYWRERALREEKAAEAEAGETEYWMRRAQVAERRLREISRLTANLETPPER